jgi:hypothetical protein
MTSGAYGDQAPTGRLRPFGPTGYAEAAAVEWPLAARLVVAAPGYVALG